MILHGRRLPDALEEFRRNFKLPYNKYLEEKGFTEEEALDMKIVKEYIRFYKDLLEHVKIFDDVEYTLSALRRRSLKMAVVSHSPRDVVEAVMEKFDLTRFFNPDVYCYGDYRKQKPNPESILVALEEAQISPNHALYIGDMREDIKAAKRAGVKSVAIYREGGSYHLEPSLRNENPTFFITDLRKVLDIVDGGS